MTDIITDLTEAREPGDTCICNECLLRRALERTMREVERLRAIERALKELLDRLDSNQEPQLWYEADAALCIREILSREAEKEKP